MVGEINKDKEVEETKTQSLLEYYNNILLPEALIYGMTVTQFWEDDPSLMWSYRLAYLRKLELQMEIDNYNSWLAGLYNLSAFQTVVANSFSSNNNLEYMQMIDTSKMREEANLSYEEKEKKRISQNDQIIRANVNNLRKII